MTEVAPDGRSGVLRSKRAECSSIVTSRKRKLREFYAVAIERPAVPNRSYHGADAPPTTPGELQFLHESDILQGRNLDDFDPPTRQQRDSDLILRFKRFLAESANAVGENGASLSSSSTRENGLHSATKFPSAAQETLGVSLGLKSDREHAHVSKINPLAPDLIASPQLSSQNQQEATNSTPEGSCDDRHMPHVASPWPGTLASDVVDTNSRYTIGSAKSDPESRDHPPRNSSRVASADRVDPMGGVKEDFTGTDSLSVALAPNPTPSSQDSMDIDDSTARGCRRTPELTSTRLPPADSSKPADALSSPGSTTQTATTPAIHEASTDTSPDNDGLQYTDLDRDEEKHYGEVPNVCVRESGTVTTNDTTSQVDSSLPDHSQALAKHEVETQLLEESAARSATEVNRATLGPDASPPQLASHPHPLPTEPSPEQPETTFTEQPNVDRSSSNPSDQTIPIAREIRDSQESSPLTAPNIQGSKQGATSATRVHPSAVAELSEARVAQSHASSANTIPQAAKAVTRMSSGAIRQKSVAEILGGGRKSVTAESSSLPSDASRQAVDLRPNVRPGKERSRKRSAPTVVFGQQQKRSADKTVIAATHSQSDNPLTQDYLAPLFVQNYSHQSKKMKSVDQLLHQAYKTVSTPDVQNAMLENQACRVLRRVYTLQQQDKWVLRQPSRCPEPSRPSSHQDVLLKEMKWMRTDFREERKWKQAVARTLAAACSLWVSSNPEQRKGLQVNSVIPPSMSPSDEDIAMVDDIEPGWKGDHATPQPDLLLSRKSAFPSDPDDESQDNFENTVAPSAIFALQEDDMVFGLRRSAASDQLLGQLPMYGSPLKVPKSDLPGPEWDPDSHWRRPALPLSKFVEGHIVLAYEGPPSKRSRYQYEQEEDDEGDEDVVFGATPTKPAALERENKDVALFSPEMKAVRDRLHAGHQFRPPTEHPMPSQSFYECRPASQWVFTEDDQLKSLVREYPYNWSLVSNIVASKSLFSSGPERRTPWECFERWVTLEGLPNDMSKTQYFRTYQNRIDAAQRTIQEHNQKISLANPNGSASAVQRKRPTTTIRVDRRRNQKHLALIDAMRKLAKKREAQIQKQQYAATMRKAPEAPQQRGPVKTPKEYSAMRWERDQQLAEKMAQFAQRQNDAQRRQLMSRAQGQATPVPSGSAVNSAQVAAQMAANPLGTARPNIPNQLAGPGQPRPRMAMQAPPNTIGGLPAHMGGGLVPPMPMNGIPQAQMQVMQAQHRMQMPNSQPDLQLVIQARRIQDQQRQAVQAQQQQAQQHAQQQGHQPPHPGAQGAPGAQGVQGVVQGVPGVQVSPTGMRTAVNGLNHQNFMANAQAALSAFNGPGAPGMSSVGGVLNMPGMPLGSPQANPVPQMNPTMMAHVLEIEASLKAKSPGLPPEQARRMAYTNYQNLVARQRQNAMTAASGGSPQQQQAMVNGMTGSSPHQYAQLLRAQQHAQQQAAAQQQHVQQQHAQQQHAAQAAAAAQHTPQHQRQQSSGGPSIPK